MRRRFSRFVCFFSFFLSDSHYESILAALVPVALILYMFNFVSTQTVRFRTREEFTRRRFVRFIWVLFARQAARSRALKSCRCLCFFVCVTVRIRTRESSCCMRTNICISFSTRFFFFESYLEGFVPLAGRPFRCVCRSFYSGQSSSHFYICGPLTG